MRILIIGSGGREHALTWKLSQRADVDELYVAPGNGGTASIATNVAIKDSDIEGLVAFAKEKAVDLVVPGPELPLTLGVVDAMQAAGIPCFGPVAACAKLEGSKAFAKEIMNAADAVIVAVGAHDVKLPIPGADGANVVSSWDVLAGTAEAKGHCVVIGGGLVGTETAEYLLEQGCTVSVVEMLDKIANGESSTILPTIMADFAKHGVKQYVGTKVLAIEGNAVKALQGEEEITIECDTVVMAVGSKKNVLGLDGVTVPVLYAGDCSGERTASIAEAIRGGYKAANEL